ncbi:hypothetical protein PQR01_36240 [Paraburkholderia rhynchosiae]|uniref:Uncharacterized protein n=1 Tax=Paraburkholderia rhynchosiae TaxID=487049 RepID=A0ACC7NPP2_9BURK
MSDRELEDFLVRPKYDAFHLRLLKSGRGGIEVTLLAEPRKSKPPSTPCLISRCEIEEACHVDCLDTAQAASDLLPGRVSSGALMEVSIDWRPALNNR